MMKMRSAVQITAENNIEEQYILGKFPDAVWVNLGEKTNFYLPDTEVNITEIMEAITDWKERNE